MKKIPTLFVRKFENHKIVDITDEITPGCEEAFKNGIATLKYDGSCCAIINGKFYKRFDAKKGRKIPDGAIPCCEPDPITGHHPHWVKVEPNDPGDKWFMEAYDNTMLSAQDWRFSTFEAIGPHFNGNPYGIAKDYLQLHGAEMIDIERNFESIRTYLMEHFIEGIVFWLHGEPICKIKRSDFGLTWPYKFN